MPIYDYECDKCGTITEHILNTSDSEHSINCSCGGQANKIISASGAFCANEDAAWIRSVTEVVDKEGGVAAQRFVKDPTRRNYKEWMKETGVRPLESGERMRPEPTNVNRLTDRVMEMRRKRNKITIN
jgi:putative FmdB family regulatory protein